MGKDDERGTRDEEANRRELEQQEVEREQAVQTRGCLIALLVVGSLALIVILRVLAA